MQAAAGRKAILYRMVMPQHVCPYGLKAKDLLERQGVSVEDHWLTTREQTDAFTHADGSTKTYRHINPGDIGVGQEVQAGQRIGALQAHDPRLTGPHLHVEATDASGHRYSPRGEIEAARRARQNAATSRMGDKMMKRSWQWPGGTSGSGSPASAAGKGTLDINLNGFPAGTRARASMDDIFKDVKASRGRQMATAE